MNVVNLVVNVIQSVMALRELCVRLSNVLIDHVDECTLPTVIVQYLWSLWTMW